MNVSVLINLHNHKLNIPASLRSNTALCAAVQKPKVFDGPAGLYALSSKGPEGFKKPKVFCDEGSQEILRLASSKRRSNAVASSFDNRASSFRFLNSPLTTASSGFLKGYSNCTALRSAQTRGVVTGMATSQIELSAGFANSKEKVQDKVGRNLNKKTFVYQYLLSRLLNGSCACTPFPKVGSEGLQKSSIFVAKQGYSNSVTGSNNTFTSFAAASLFIPKAENGKLKDDQTGLFGIHGVGRDQVRNFFPYRKSFLCYWLFPFVGFVFTLGTNGEIRNTNNTFNYTFNSNSAAASSLTKTNKIIYNIPNKSLHQNPSGFEAKRTKQIEDIRFYPSLWQGYKKLKDRSHFYRSGQKPRFASAHQKPSVFEPLNTFTGSASSSSLVPFGKEGNSNSFKDNDKLYQQCCVYLQSLENYLSLNTNLNELENTASTIGLLSASSLSKNLRFFDNLSIFELPKNQRVLILTEDSSKHAKAQENSKFDLSSISLRILNSFDKVKNEFLLKKPLLLWYEIPYPYFTYINSYEGSKGSEKGSTYLDSSLYTFVSNAKISQNLTFPHIGVQGRSCQKPLHQKPSVFEAVFDTLFEKLKRRSGIFYTFSNVAPFSTSPSLSLSVGKGNREVFEPNDGPEGFKKPSVFCDAVKTTNKFHLKLMAWSGALPVGQSNPTYDALGKNSTGLFKTPIVLKKGALHFKKESASSYSHRFFSLAGGRARVEGEKAQENALFLFSGKNNISENFRRSWLLRIASPFGPKEDQSPVGLQGKQTPSDFLSTYSNVNPISSYLKASVILDNYAKNKSMQSWARSAKRLKNEGLKGSKNQGFFVTGRSEAPVLTASLQKPKVFGRSELPSSKIVDFALDEFFSRFFANGEYDSFIETNLNLSSTSQKSKSEHSIVSSILRNSKELDQNKFEGIWTEFLKTVTKNHIKENPESFNERAVKKEKLSKTASSGFGNASALEAVQKPVQKPKVFELPLTRDFCSGKKLSKETLYKLLFDSLEKSFFSLADGKGNMQRNDTVTFTETGSSQRENKRNNIQIKLSHPILMSACQKPGRAFLSNSFSACSSPSVKKGKPTATTVKESDKISNEKQIKDFTFTRKALTGFSIDNSKGRSAAVHLLQSQKSQLSLLATLSSREAREAREARDSQKSRFALRALPIFGTHQFKNINEYLQYSTFIKKYATNVKNVLLKSRFKESSDILANKGQSALYAFGKGSFRLASSKRRSNAVASSFDNRIKKLRFLNFQFLNSSKNEKGVQRQFKNQRFLRRSAVQKPEVFDGPEGRNALSKTVGFGNASSQKPLFPGFEPLDAPFFEKREPTGFEHAPKAKSPVVQGVYTYSESARMEKLLRAYFSIKKTFSALSAPKAKMSKARRAEAVPTSIMKKNTLNVLKWTSRLKTQINTKFITKNPILFLNNDNPTISFKPNKRSDALKQNEAVQGQFKNQRLSKEEATEFFLEEARRSTVQKPEVFDGPEGRNALSKTVGFGNASALEAKQVINKPQKRFASALLNKSTDKNRSFVKRASALRARQGIEIVKQFNDVYKHKFSPRLLIKNRSFIINNRFISSNIKEKGIHPLLLSRFSLGVVIKPLLPSSFLEGRSGLTQLENNRISLKKWAYDKVDMSLETKRKYTQKKRRRKKLKKETRRRKKRKRFYPRPNWIRYRLYLNFLKKRYDKNSKTYHNTFSFYKGSLHKSFQNFVVKGMPYSSKELSKGRSENNFKRFASASNNRPYIVLKNKETFADSSLISFNPSKDNFTISRVVLGDFKRVLWKSYWLRSNLNPYLKRVKTYLTEIKESTQRWEFFRNVNNFVNFVGGFVSPLLLSPFESPAELHQQGGRNALPKPSVLDSAENYMNFSKWDKSLYLSEYNRITYQRIQEFISQIRENALLPVAAIQGSSEGMGRNGKGQSRTASSATHISHLNLQDNKREAVLSKRKSTDFWVKLGKTLMAESYAQSTLLKKSWLFASRTKEPSLPQLRMYWAFSKTSLLRTYGANGSFQNFNKRKETWTVGKTREQTKYNKTKKIYRDLSLKLKTLLNEQYELWASYGAWDSNFETPAFAKGFKPKFERRSGEQVKQEKDSPASASSFGKARPLVLKNALKKARLKEEKSIFLFNKSVSNNKYKYENLNALTLHQYKKNIQLRSAPLAPPTVRFASAFERPRLNSPLTISPAPSAWSTKLTNKSSYWWSDALTAKGFMPLELSQFQFLNKTETSRSLRNSESYLPPSQAFTDFTLLDLGSRVSPSRDTKAFQISALLFHFCSIISLISISQIRDLLKLYFLGISKIYKSSIGILGFSFDLFASIQKTSQRQKLSASPQGQKLYKNRFKNQRFLTKLFLTARFTSPFRPHQKPVFELPFGREKREPGFGRSELPLKINRSFFEAKQAKRKENHAKVKEAQTISLNYQKSSPYTNVKELKTLSKKQTSIKTRSASHQKPLHQKPEVIKKTEVFFGQKRFKNRRFLTEPVFELPLNYLPFVKTYTTLYSLICLNFLLENLNGFYFKTNRLFKQTFDIFGRFGPRSLFNFLEKPGELIGDWIAYMFLVEWASDMTNTIPENVDVYLGTTTLKATRALHGVNLLSIYQNHLVSFSQKTQFFDKPSLFDMESFVRRSNLSILNIGSTFIQRRIYHLYEILLQRFYQPDTDLIVRQKKGVIFWDIWGDFLMQVAEDSNINISELTSLKEEQIKLFEKAQEEFKGRSEARKGETRASSQKPLVPVFEPPLMRFTNESPKTENFENHRFSDNKSFRFLKRKEFKNQRFLTRSGVKGFKSFVPLLLLNSISAKGFSVLDKGTTPSTLPTGLAQALIPFSLSPSDKSKGAKQSSIVVSKSLLLYTAKLFQAQQFLSYQGKDTELFIDLHPPKSFSMVSFLKRNESVQHPIGSLVCQIFSGIMSKQISKNILVVGPGSSIGRDGGTEKTLLIQAIAGETELKIITDNAYRYAMVHRGVAVGIKLLRDVFDSLALHTPCLFLIEDIHAIGERRPLLISDDENTKGAESNSFGSQRDEIHEKNQVLYQLNKHVITHYRKPYKGDFSMLIPTNHFCFDLFRRNTGFAGNYPSKKQNLSFNAPRISIKSEGRSDQSNDSQTSNTSLSFSLSTHATVPSRLLVKSSQLFAPPATSPFSVLTLKEEKKFKPYKIVSEMPWGGLPGEQLAQVSKSSYSVRVKVALLADMAISTLSVKLDMITDLLVIIDSVKGNRGFVVFATTHVPYILDPALRRPGRLDETITLGLFPSILSRWEILKSSFGLFTAGKEQTGFNKGLSLDLTYSITFGHHPLLLQNPLLPVFDSPSLFSNSAVTLRARDEGASKNSEGNSEFSQGNSFSKRMKQNNSSFAEGELTQFANKAQAQNSSLIHTYSQTIANKLLPSRFNSRSASFPSLLFLNSSENVIKDRNIIKEIENIPKIQTRASSFKNRRFLNRIKGLEGRSEAFCFVNGQKQRQGRSAELFELPVFEALRFKTLQALRKRSIYSILKISNSTFFTKSKMSTLPISKKRASLLPYKGNKTDLSYNNQEVACRSSFGDSERRSAEFFGYPKEIQIMQQKQKAPFDVNKILSQTYFYASLLLYEASINVKNSPQFLDKPHQKANLFELPSLFVPNQTTPLSLYASLYASPQQFKAFIVNFISGKLGETLLFSGIRPASFVTQNKDVINGFNSIPSSPSVKSVGVYTSYGLSSTWKALSSLVISFVQKRFLYHSNLIVPKFLYFNNQSSLLEPPSPPSSNILLPARRYENYKRSFSVFSGQQISKKVGIMDKIQAHQQQRLIKRLYGFPVQESFRSEVMENRSTSFSNASLMIGSFSSILQKPSNSNWFVKNRILMRHKNYLTNQWWNGQLSEHNAETTFLSDIDWRSTFVESIGDLILDFPDADQHYNPRNRRWLLTSRSGSYHNWFDFDKTIYSEIYSHFIFDSFVKAYYIYEQNREVLDFYAYYVLKNGLHNVLNEFAILKLYKRFGTLSKPIPPEKQV